MKKRILLSILGLLFVIGVLAAVKILQIRAMIDQGKNMVPPPETVTVAAASAESWETSLQAVGSLAAVQGVTVAAEVGGKIAEIAFESGEKARKGDLLVRQDTSVEEAQLPGAEAQEKLTRSVLARDVEMLEGKIISQADYDASEAAHRVAVAQANGIRATIAKKSIRAPFGGSLGIRQANLGQILREGDPVVTLQSLDPIYVNFSLPQQELRRLRAGLPIRVSSDAIPGREIAGRITTVNPLVDADTRNVQLQATMRNPGEKLRPGMYVNARVVLPVREKVVVLPATSVLHAPYGDSVFLVEDDKGRKGGKVVRQQFVRLGERRGDFVAVTEGVKEGDGVVSTGVFKLRNGQAVTVDNRLSPKFRLAPSPRDG
ncbi:MAG: efflux RND transporter periplasmic adaptor subunit [Deltaproteobacteria bacterium]|nr:efflux RND transporter periplasmic adaptor subunit [Deltaproteobacteria bacterium]